MSVRGEVVLQAVREMCPGRFAVEGDRTGLQVGRSDRDVERVLCTMDLTLAVAEEARELGAGLVISHHAVIFRALKHLRTDDFKGRILETLIKGDIAVYVPHTAMDVVTGGMNDHLARTVGLQSPRFLEQTGEDDAQLLIVPGADLEQDVDGLIASLRERGALRVEVAGGRLEVVAPRRRSRSLVRFVSKRCGCDPTVLPLASDAAPRGIGRIGKLAQPEPLLDLARRLKAAVGAPGVRVVASGPDVVVSKAAVLGGDGRSYVHAAVFAGADVLVTGDVDHHTALEARARGLSLIDLGHWGSEKQVVELLVAGLRERLVDEEVEVLASQVDTNPFAFV